MTVGSPGLARKHDKLNLFVFIIKTLITTNHGRIRTYDEGLLDINSHVSVITCSSEIT